MLFKLNVAQMIMSQLLTQTPTNTYFQAFIIMQHTKSIHTADKLDEFSNICNEYSLTTSEASFISLCLVASHSGN